MLIQNHYFYKPTWKKDRHWLIKIDGNGVVCESDHIEDRWLSWVIVPKLYEMTWKAERDLNGGP